MLVNAKPEELIKYSKGTYDKDSFVETVKEKWELTDLQIRMTYLISDLAVKAQGVFSITHKNFVEMFNERFEIEVSLSTVRRFFDRLSKLGVLSINGAKRKNNQQSANIYIIEVEKSEDKSDEQPCEQPYEHPVEHPCEQHNITINKTINKTINNNLVNNNLLTNNQDTINKLIKEYMLKGLTKKLCFRVLDEVKLVKNIKNFGAYLRKCLENTLFKSNVKRDLMNLAEQEFTNTYENNNAAQFNWL